MSCYFTKNFAHLSAFSGVGYSSVYKLIGWDPQGLTYIRLTAKTVEKAMKHAQS